MWLLHAETRRLESFVDDRQMLVEYAILSHTWDIDEVTFDDIHHEYASSMRGYRKIDFACSQALEDGIEYVWVDTCCIDKRSSAELSEAINSMYRWYHDAFICYAYLSDLDQQGDSHLDGSDSDFFYDWRTDVTESRWFKRGWTLQELIAPKEVVFYDARWTSLGSKTDLVDELESITRISSAILKDRAQLRRASVAQRMSWAAGRSTSRVEDQAYALLGLFDVNMPLLYGEGSKAFTRLQEVIISSQDWGDRDHSILLWDSDDGDLLAPSPREFMYGHRIVSWTPPRDENFEFSKKGLYMTVLARPENPAAVPGEQLAHDAVGSSGNDASDILTVVLNCRYVDHKQLHQLALRVQRRPRIVAMGHSIQDEDQYNTVYDKLPETTIVSHKELSDFIPMDIIIARKPYCWPSQSIKKISLASGLTSIEDYPTNSMTWHRGHAIVQLEMDEEVKARGAVRVRKRFETEQWPDLVLDICLVHEIRKPPKLSIGIQGGLRSELREGEQHMIDVEAKQVLRITASYVLMEEDLLWHLELTRPVLANDISDLQTLSGMDHDRMPRNLSLVHRGPSVNRRVLEWGQNQTLPEVLQRPEAFPEVVNAQLMNVTAPLLQEQYLQRHTLTALADAVERIQRQLESLEPRHEIAYQEPCDLPPRPSYTLDLQSRIHHGRKPLKALRSLILGYLGRRLPRASKASSKIELQVHQIYELDDDRSYRIHELDGREIKENTGLSPARDQTDTKSSSDSDSVSSSEDSDDGGFSFVTSIYDLREEIPLTFRIDYDPSSAVLPLPSSPINNEAVASEASGEEDLELNESDDAWSIVSHPEDIAIHDHDYPSLQPDNSFEMERWLREAIDIQKERPEGNRFIQIIESNA